MISLLEKNGLAETVKADFGSYWQDAVTEAGGVEKAFEIGKEEAERVERLLGL